MLTALWIVLLGMAIIFLVLGLLLGVMILLNNLLKPEKKDGSYIIGMAAEDFPGFLSLNWQIASVVAGGAMLMLVPLFS